ncbi:hypothetical protein [Acetobacterium wieringae]|uniref:hypothetical protein n=1 Tax=Acetobacterium wieringae TaxID=52694 RepID=UPI0026F1E4BC|nr:hypothetical protein [Acetobacterium wieringae]
MIVISHDLSSINDINKAIKEIKDAAKIKFSRDVTDFLLLELVDMNLTDMPYSRNEYNQLLKLIYDYGSGNSLNNDLVIGNVMRRVFRSSFM